MNQLQGIYCRARNPGSAFLRTAMWSSWSHVATVFGPGLWTPGDDPTPYTVIDATFWHDVSQRPLKDVLDSSSKFSLKLVDCPDIVAAQRFAVAQIGKKYDTKGVLGIGLHRDWQEDDCWFCSELFEAILAAGGNQRFINQSGRVTPQHSWMVR